MKKFLENHRWILLTLAFFHCVTIFPIIGSIVTWIDPAWYTYHAFDLYYGRSIGTNLNLAELFYTVNNQSLSFYDYDLTSTPFWPYVNFPFFSLFGPSFVVSRVISAVIMLATGYYLFKTIRLYPGNLQYALLATSLFMVDYTVFWASTSARPDALYTFLSVAGMYYLVKFFDERVFLDGLATSACFFFSILTHPLAAAVPVAVSVMLFSHEIRRRIIERETDWRRVVQTWWPILLTFVATAVWLAINLAGFQGMIGTTAEFVNEDSGSTKFLSYIHDAFSQELSRKFIDSYTRRYQLLTLTIFVLSALYLTSRYRKLKVTERNFLIFTTILFIVVAVYDVGHTVPHLIFQTPYISLVIAMALHHIYATYHRAGWFVIGLFTLLMANPLLPRAAKYYQVYQNGTATDYEQFTRFVKNKIPPHSKIVADTTLMWGLHDQGYRILQSHHIRSEKQEYLDQIEYVVADTKLEQSSDPFLRTLPERIDFARANIIGSFGLNCDYCYQATIYQIIKPAE